MQQSQLGGECQCYGKIQNHPHSYHCKNLESGAMMATMTIGNDCSDDNWVIMAMMTIGNEGNDGNEVCACCQRQVRPIFPLPWIGSIPAILEIVLGQ